MSNSEMSNFFGEQGRTRVFGETYSTYVAAGKPRRTPPGGKRAIYGWALTKELSPEPSFQSLIQIDKFIGNYIFFKRKFNGSGQQKMKAEKTSNKSSISPLTLCGIVFICLFFISGCFLQKGHDAEADLMATILFPTEADEKTEAHKLRDVYEVRGLLTNESILHETAWGAAYVPHLVLDVEETFEAELKGKDITSTVSTKNEYIRITCRQVSEDYHGIYQMGETTSAALDKKVRVKGVVYRCGDNWYICEKDETEIYCDIDGKAAYDSTHIQLINLDIDELGKPK